MARPVVSLPHPLIDASGPGWAATHTRVPVVGLNSGRSALLTDATRANVRVLVVTPPTSRLTYPLFHLLRLLGGVWLTRDDEGRLRHAVSGQELPDYAAAVDPRAALGSLDEPQESVEVDPEVLPLRLPPERLSAWVQVTVAVHHPAREETLLGATAEALVDALAGTSPTAWGTGEPVTASWDRTGITGLARARVPLDTRVYLSGAGDRPYSGFVRAARTDIGVTEETRLVVAVPDAVAAEGADVTGRLLSRLAERQQVLMATAWASRGAADATIAPYWPSLPQPLAAVVGARAVRSMELDLGRLETDHGATRVGNRRVPSLALTFGPEDVRWNRFAAALRAAGPAKLLGALHPPSLVAQEVEDAS